MKFIVYYIVAVSANIVSVFVFSNYINISVISTIPLILIVLSIFQAVYFNKHNDLNTTAYGSGFTKNEEAELSKYTSKSLLSVIPVMIPFILFFDSLLKIISVLLYIFGFIAGPVIYKIKYRDDLNSRINREKKELEEQKKREEMGMWK